MDDDRDLRDWPNRCRLFPLPRLVLFPHAILPLHIFEPRYRQMTEEALADDKLVTMVQLLPQQHGRANHLAAPNIAEVGCLGQIIQHERLPDGRFNFLLLGRKRVHLKREIAGGRMFREAEADILEDSIAEPEEPRRTELIALFRRVFQHQDKLDSDLNALLENPIPLGVLTDIMAHALAIPVELKQWFLAEPKVDVRVEVLLSTLGREARKNSGDPATVHGFPPPFSVN